MIQNLCWQDNKGENVKNIILLMLLGTIFSCSFKGNDGEATQEDKRDLRISSRLGTDTDGDQMSDNEEERMGRNPHISDLPDVRVRFIQNYQIKVLYGQSTSEEDQEFLIDTKVHQDNPDFKYRVGDIFIRNESFKNAANIGKFSTHSWGEVSEHDLSWVSFPEVDPRFYSEQVLSFRKSYNSELDEIKDISITLENSVRLKANSGFREIKNLKLNFYYYDYERESYELLKSEIIERNFQAGVNETFEVQLSNVPKSLLLENYLKRGEFIISELADFDIPELETTYQALLSNVKSKAIPVIYNTPLESRVAYVGVNGGSASFSEILENLFPKKVTIVDNKLEKIEQFESNLPEFTYLSEVRELDKKGKWYIFTNKLIQHYLDHKYTPKDVISLSYLTGNVLANQDNEKVMSLGEAISSGDGERIYALGNVSPNSKIEFQLQPKKLWGEINKRWSDQISGAGGCSGNCRPREFTCYHEFSFFEPIDSAFTFSKDFNGEVSRIKLLINQDEFNLVDLIKEKKAQSFWVGENLHIEIDNINQIKELKEFDENVIFLKLQAVKGTNFSGIKLSNWTGRDWYSCIPGTVNLAVQNGWPVSVESRDFASWQHQVNWNAIKRGENRSYQLDFSVTVSSTINNHFN